MVGFSAGESFFGNHPRSSSARELACANSPATRWSNVVYHVSGGETRDIFALILYVCVYIVSPEVVELSYDVVLGDTVDVAVHCQVFGDPQPTISYTSAGTVVATAQLDRYTRSSTLMMTNITEGININCTATNVWGSTSRRIFLDIKGMDN